jgi:hypothetical protein
MSGTTSPAAMRARIDEIDAILQSGAKSVSLDGVNVTWDLDSLRTERTDLERRLSPKTRRRAFILKPIIGG